MVAADSKAKLLEDAEKYVLHGKIQLAISAYLKIVSLNPSDILIINTLGDLYLRQNNISEANKYFSLVAENFVQNNFLQKAIAVYKKILGTDPNNIEIGSTMAVLYAKQGLRLDAYDLYLRIASLLEKEGKIEEALDAYEKCLDLDPSNSGVRQKMATLHQKEGLQENARHCGGTGWSFDKTGDLMDVAHAIERAAQWAPLNPPLNPELPGEKEIQISAASDSPSTNVPTEPEMDLSADLLDLFLAKDGNSSPAKAIASEPAGPNSIAMGMHAEPIEKASPPDRNEAMAFFDERFNLGMIYRDMGLIGEAIEEFETALKAMDVHEGDIRVIQCCGMLSACFLDKHMPSAALDWCQKGLARSDISFHEAMALRYDMGIAHAMAGNAEEALECFERIFNADPGYRDVAQRMDKLRFGFERHAP